MFLSSKLDFFPLNLTQEPLSLTNELGVLCVNIPGFDFEDVAEHLLSWIITPNQNI